VPAGDIGVGGREIGYLFGQYKKLRNEFTGVLTGKGAEYGGSLIRPEATGFGAIYFVREMLATKGETMKGKTVSVSGFGNVAWGAALKAVEYGAKVVTISGPDGYVYDPEGISGDKIDYMLELRASNQDIVSPYAERYPEATFFPGKKPWEQKVDIAIPCAIQNELNEEDAKTLIANGCQVIAEASNMGCTAEAAFLATEKIGFAPGKAVNAGGVAVSGLEMTQNSMRLNWTEKEVDDRLDQIMTSIHNACVKYGTEPNGKVNYIKGANIGGFVKVADAMIAQGVV
jgi:glutamate dehydrogenase (NADP+)